MHQGVELEELSAMAGEKDLVLRVLVLVALIWAALVGVSIDKEVRARQAKNPDAWWPYSDTFTGLGFFVGMLAVQLIFRQLFDPVARAMIPKKPRWGPNVWGAKVTRCCDSIFKCVYYLVMTIWCYLLLKDEPWLPGVLGGSGETRFCWTDYPLQVVSPGLRRLYVVSVGYHLSEVVMLLLEVHHPDFWEMLLHHSVSCSLVCYSYLLNYVRLGSLVLLLHGATDVFIYLSKAIVDTPNTRCTIASYFALVAAYAWFRIFVFPVAIMRSAWVESVREASSSIFGWGYMNFAMFLLFLLHMYWFGLILKIGTHFRKTGQAKDLQSNLSSLELKKQS